MNESDRNPAEWSVEGAEIAVSASTAGGIVILRPRGGDARSAESAMPASEGAMPITDPGPPPGAVRIGEFMGAPHSPLSSHVWEARQEPGALTLATAWRSVMVEKRVSLIPGASAVRLEYAFLNAGEVLVRPAFGLRLEVPARPGMRWSVPAVGGRRSGDVDDGAAIRRYLRPDSPWCGIDVEGKGIAALFPPGVLDAVEVWLDRPRGVFFLTPLIYYIGLSPGTEARVACVVARTAGGSDVAEQLQRLDGADLTSSYGPAAPERRAWAEALVREGAARPNGPDPGAAEACRILQERAEMLAAGREARLQVIERLASGEVTIEEALDRMKAGIDLPPHL